MTRLHVTGASGSGTTTLAAALCARNGWRHVDSDDFLWLATDPPYTDIRPREERVALMRAALDAATDWAVSGSLSGWGDVFVPRFDLVVYLAVPTEERLRRLALREAGRYGAAAIAPGGSMHDAFIEFMAWTAAYDDGAPTMRSRALHDRWLAALPCAVLRLDGTQPVAALAEAVETKMAARPATIL